jgi:hypothetical protein
MRPTKHAMFLTLYISLFLPATRQYPIGAPCDYHGRKNVWLQGNGGGAATLARATP